MKMLQSCMKQKEVLGAKRASEVGGSGGFIIIAEAP